MTSALLERPAVLSRPTAELEIRPADIAFQNVTPNLVRLSVTISNLGDARSEPATMAIQAAALGTFVPWKDVTSLAVPPIPPRGHVEVSADLSAPNPAFALGKFSRVPPRKLLTAVAADDGNYDPAPARKPTPAPSGLGQLFSRLLGGHSRTNDKPQLPGDPLQLLARPHVHWAGNINVHIGRRAVERHLAQELRIYPGRTNLAVFFVGDRRDEYQFELAGSGAAWDAALFDCPEITPLAGARSPANALPQLKWIRMNRLRAVLLAICPPEDCDGGSVEVHVRQRSTGKDALVEFSLDPHAAGAGCYTV